MNSMNDTGDIVGRAPGRTHGFRTLIVTGLLAALAAVAATTLAAALAEAAGVDFEISDGETIPLSGIAFVTGFFSVVGIIIAVALLRWSARPADRFVQTTVSLTLLSLVPPLLSGAGFATTATLIGLHIIPATVMILALARRLRRDSVDRS